MNPPTLLGHPPLSLLRAIALVVLLVVTAVVIGFPIGDAIACTIVPTSKVYISDLPSLTDPDAQWKKDFEETHGEPPPEVTGAFRSEVIDDTPETEDEYSGAVWAATNRWGDAEPELVDVRKPISKELATSCDGNQAPLGSSAYFLWTEDDVAMPLTVGDDESEADEALDAAFGESEVIGTADDSPSPREVSQTTKSIPDPISVRFHPAGFGLLAALVVIGGSGAAWLTTSRLRR